MKDRRDAQIRAFHLHRRKNSLFLLPVLPAAALVSLPLHDYFRPEFEGPKGRANSCVSLTPQEKQFISFTCFACGGTCQPSSA